MSNKVIGAGGPRLNRRAAAATLAGAASALAFPSILRAQDKGQVVFAGYGGRPQDIQRKLFFEPFTKETGIKVIDATGISIAKVRAMVKTGNVEWDVVQGVPGETLVLAEEGMLEAIDYAQMDQKIVKQLPPETMIKHGVGFTYSTQAICFNTKAYPPGGRPRPTSWKDFWDATNFPGKRMLPAGSYVVNPIEPALLADGVAKDKLYPLDLPRAYASLTRIKPHVVKWVASSSAVPQALVDGEADLGMAASGRIFELKAQGAPVDFVYDEAVTNHSFWFVPKGSKNYANALKLISFITRPEVVAEYSKQVFYGSVNPESLKFMTPDEAKVLNSAPENFVKQVHMRPDWWAERDARGVSNLDRNARLWNEWITKG